MKPVLKELTPEQKMINHLRRSIEVMKERHRKELRAKDDWLHLRSLEYQNIEAALTMKCRVLSKFNDALKARIEGFYLEEVRPEIRAERLAREIESGLRGDHQPEATAEGK